MVAAAALEPMLALMLKPLLDSAGAGVAGGRAGLFAGVAGAILLLLITATYGRSYLGGWLDITMQRDLRRAMAVKLERLPLSRMRSEQAGAITTRFMSFVPGMTGPVMPLCTALVQEPLKTIFYAGQMFYLEWQLALIVCAALPVTAVAIRALGMRMKKVAVHAQQEVSRAQHRLNESVALAPIIRVHGGGERTAATFSSLRAAMLRVQIVLAASQPLAMLVISIPSVIVVYYVAGAIDSQAMSPGDVAAFVASMLLLPRSVRIIARASVLLENVFPAAREVFGFLDSQEEDDSGTVEISRAKGEVIFDDVWLRYARATRPALAGLSARIASGETVALVGRSGAGKTSLANLVPRFYAPQRGVVKIDGTDVREFSLRSLRRQIALVTQEPLLFDDTVAANVCHPESPDEADRERIRIALRDAAADFVSEMPQGEDSPIGENGALLSGGQRQRLALARAFYRDAPIVILDEATSALDAETESKIKGALRRLLDGRTALVIAHRFATLDIADRILVLDEGRLAGEGTSEHLLETCPLFAELHRAQKI